MSLLPEGFKVCLATTTFLEVDAHKIGRRNEANLMHILKLSSINTWPGHRDGQGGNCDLEHFSKGMSYMTCQSLSLFYLLIFSLFRILLLTIICGTDSCFLVLPTLTVEPPLCFFHCELSAFPRVNFYQPGFRWVRSHPSDQGCRAFQAPTTIVSLLSFSTWQLLPCMALSANAPLCE